MSPVNRLFLHSPLPSLMLPPPLPPRSVCPSVYPPYIHLVFNNDLLVPMPPPLPSTPPMGNINTRAVFLPIEETILGGGKKAFKIHLVFEIDVHIYEYNRKIRDIKIIMHLVYFRFKMCLNYRSQMITSLVMSGPPRPILCKRVLNGPNRPF